jgi:hypothetical protein
MKNLFVMVVIMFVFQLSEARTKRALIIGIGSYPAKSGWNIIHGDNDVPLISGTLSRKGFDSKNIVCLTNENATKKRIISSFNQMIAQAQPNDLIYIHFSTHGQQVTDLNGDEDDGLDEAIVPYDAQKTFVKGVYEGKNHLIDDELNGYLSQLRSKIGKDGSLLVVIDACHSGDATRGNNSEADSAVLRGTNDIFNLGTKKITQLQPKKKLDWVVFSATQPYQNNYEYKLNGEYFGSLSYAINLAISELSTQVSFSKLFELIQSKRTNMKVSGYPQRPMIDGADFYQKQIAF